MSEGFQVCGVGVFDKKSKKMAGFFADFSLFVRIHALSARGQ
jgi:hypothetical protein